MNVILSEFLNNNKRSVLVVNVFAFVQCVGSISIAHEESHVCTLWWLGSHSPCNFLTSSTHQKPLKQNDADTSKLEICEVLVQFGFAKLVITRTVECVGGRTRVGGMLVLSTDADTLDDDTLSANVYS